MSKLVKVCNLHLLRGQMRFIDGFSVAQVCVQCCTEAYWCKCGAPISPKNRLHKGT